MTPDGVPEISIVLPACNEAANIGVMQERLSAVAAGLGVEVEFVWVNDGSTDGTGDILDELARRDGRVRALHLSRNFGHMAALTAGLEAARGTGAVVTLDADGQHPPELIPELVARWRGGADIVQTVRRATAGEPLGKRVGSMGFYMLLERLADINLPAGSADFRLLDRQAVDALNSLPERDRFVRGLVRWIGFRTEHVEFDAPARLGGEPKYGAGRMIRFALSGIASFSTRPLRLAFWLGFGVFVLASAYAAYVLWAVATGAPVERGWASLMLVVLFLGSVQLITLGIASEYLGRLTEEAKRRPVYIVRKRR